MNDEKITCFVLEKNSIVVANELDLIRDSTEVPNNGVHSAKKNGLSGRDW